MTVFLNSQSSGFLGTNKITGSVDEYKPLIRIGHDIDFGDCGVDNMCVECV
jgi:hypothetical protein